MGIAKGAVKVMLAEASQRPFKGQALTLGRQDIWISYDLLQEMAKEFGHELSSAGRFTLSNKTDLAKKGYISDNSLFTSLGFSDVKALDVSDYESADFIFDLNSDTMPEHLLEAFDVIIDGGTIEHIFHIPNALNNIYKMLRQGGRVIHISPSSNHMDHGFYMFSPTLFWDFYRENKFEINNFQVFRYTPRHYADPWEISNYQPGCLDPISFGGLDDAMYGIACIATKTKDSTGNLTPQQGGYVYNQWRTKERIDETGETQPAAPPSLSRLQPIKERLKHFPILYQILRFPVNLIRRSLFRNRPRRQKGLHLRVVARY